MSEAEVDEECNSQMSKAGRRFKLQKLEEGACTPDDILTGLPIAILRRLCLLLSGCPPAALNETSPLAYAAQNTPELQALGSCCKHLQSIADDVRPSICFGVQEQCEVQSYLRRMSHLTSVTINDWNSPYTSTSLRSLHSILPGLTCLSLRDHMTQDVGKVIAQSLPLWASSLQRLTLSGIGFYPCPATGHGGFKFLSQLSVLTDLDMIDVQTPLMTEDIIRSTSLRRIRMHMEKKIQASNTITLDLSSCTSLQELVCSKYKIVTLNVLGLHALCRLDCCDNAIATILGLSACTALQSLSCSGNALKSLHVRGCLKLQELNCSKNPITELEVSGCAKLGILICDYAPATQVDLSGCTALQHVNFRGSMFRSLDMQACSLLVHLDATGSRDLAVLDHLAGLMHLRTLNVMGSSISNLDVSGCVALEALECSGCKNLKALCAGGCSKLVSISSEDCVSLEELDCHWCGNLKQLHLSGSGSFGEVTLQTLVEHQGVLRGKWNQDGLNNRMTRF